METLGSSTPGDGSRSPKEADATAPASPGKNSIDDGDGSMKYPAHLKFYHRLGYSDYDSFFEALRQEIFCEYRVHLAPKLLPIAEVDSVKRFCDLCGAWPQYLSVRRLFLPEIVVSLVCYNALRCTRAVLQRTAPQLSHYKVDLNVPHLYGVAPLHAAAEAFNVDMIRLLLRHGASPHVRTKGTKVIEGLLPLHVAVENAAMHKYLEDHWAYGEPVENLVFILCLPEMKLFLDTVRLIAKHTDNIVDEIWSYIDNDRLVPASILLLAAQEQLRGRVNASRAKVFLSGFDDVKSRTDAAARALHRQVFAMIKDGKNGRALKQLKHKKEVLQTADTIIGIVYEAGEALEKYIQTHSEVPHDKIIEHVSAILNDKGIVTYGKGLDIGNLDCYQYPWQTLIDKSNSQRGASNEADKSSSLKAECKVNASPKGMKIDHVRNKFFPFWKSVLSARLPVQLPPLCQPSVKDTARTKPSVKDTTISKRSAKDTTSAKQSKGIKNVEQQRPTTIPTGYAKDIRLFPLKKPVRSYYTLASMTLKALRRG